MQHRYGGPRQTNEQRKEILRLWEIDPELAKQEAIARGLSPWYAYKLAHSMGMIETYARLKK